MSSYIYILTNATNRVLYVGVTSNLVSRVYEHKQKLVKGFSAKYHNLALPRLLRRFAPRNDKDIAPNKLFLLA